MCPTLAPHSRPTYTGKSLLLQLLQGMTETDSSEIFLFSPLILIVMFSSFFLLFFFYVCHQLFLSVIIDLSSVFSLFLITVFFFNFATLYILSQSLSCSPFQPISFHYFKTFLIVFHSLFLRCHSTILEELSRVRFSGSNLSSLTYQMYDLGQDICTLCASVFSSVKQE